MSENTGAVVPAGGALGAAASIVHNVLHGVPVAPVAVAPVVPANDAAQVPPPPVAPPVVAAPVAAPVAASVAAPVVTAPVAPAAAALVAPLPPTDPSGLGNRFQGEVAAPAPAPDIPEAPPARSDGKQVSSQELYTWGNLRHRAKVAEEEAAALKATVGTLEAERKIWAEEKAALVTQLDETKRDRDGLSEQLGKVSLAESPEFKQRFDAKISAIKGTLAADLQRFANLEPAKAATEASKLLDMSAADVQAALAEGDPMLVGRVMARVEEAETVKTQRDIELQQWRETSAANGVTAARARVVESAEKRRGWVDLAVQTEARAGHPIFASSDPQIRDFAKRVVAEAQGFIQTAPEEALVRAAVTGFSAPYLYDTINQLTMENTELRDRLGRSHGISAVPMFAGEPPPAEPPAPPAPSPAVAVKPVASAATYARDAAREAVHGFLSGSARPR